MEVDEGRAVRQAKIKRLADGIFCGLVKPDAGEYLGKTGSLVSHKSLRYRKTAKALELIRASLPDCEQKRVWTKASIRDAIRLMVNERGLTIPTTPGFTFKEWLKQQTVVVHELTQKARKNLWWVRKMQSVDNMDTQLEWFQDSSHRLNETDFVTCAPEPLL